MDRPFSPRTLAEHYGVHVNTVYGWVKAGAIGYFKTPGGDIRFRPSDVQAYEESQWRAPGSPNPTTDSGSATGSGTSPGPLKGRRSPFQLGLKRASRPKSGKRSSSLVSAQTRSPSSQP